MSIMASAQDKLTLEKFHAGDIIFQMSDSKQCEAVKLATHSPYSHCGVLFQEKEEWFVLEAVEPVRIISLNEFIKHGLKEHFVVKRLKSSVYELNLVDLTKMYVIGKKWLGKHYDIYFEWNTNNLYCSELVWKLYHESTQIELCKTKRLQDFDLNHPIVKEIMEERYGAKIPYAEQVVAPSDLFDSEKLELVFQQGKP